MAKIVITKENGGVYVDFGEYASAELESPQGFHPITIIHVTPVTIKGVSGVGVITDGRDRQNWNVSHEEPGEPFMKIDSINGVAPSSTADLVKKITELM